MIKVMMLGPFDGKGRYQGGIYTVVNGVLDRKEQLLQQDVELMPFDTCRIQRKDKDTGKLNLANVKNALQLMKDATQYIKAEKPDVFYMHTSVRFALLKDLIVMRHIKKKTGIKTALHIHFAEIEKIFTGIKILDRWMLSTIRKCVDALVLLSQQTLEQFVELGVAKDRCHLLYNFTSVSYTEEELQEKTVEQTRTMLFVGSVGERKGINDILTVLQQVKEPYKFQICGGFENDQAKMRFEELAKPLGNSVEFLGFVNGEEKRTVYRNADVLLLPSYGEGLPMVILEALEAGCGVITTPVGAIGEIIGKENGVVIQPGDLGALQKAIEEYLTMDIQQLQQQQQHNHRVAAQYSLSAFVNKLAEISKAALVEKK